MKKLGLAALLALPLLGGCYAYVPAHPYYGYGYGYHHYSRPPVARVYVAPPPVVVAPPVPRVYW